MVSLLSSDIAFNVTANIHLLGGSIKTLFGCRQSDIDSITLFAELPFTSCRAT